MPLINNNTKLCDIVINEPSSITVLNRFNIILGLGDRTIQDICKEKGMNTDFFVTILNVYINENYFPEEIFKAFSLNNIAEYIQKNNSYYKQFQLPNIERHFNSLVTRSDNDNNNLELLRKFFFEVKNELIKRIDMDSLLLPKYLNHNLNKQELSEQLQLLKPENDSIEEKINDLVNMFVIHLKGNYDINLCHAVLVAIMSLQKDIKQNNRIRFRILLPLLESYNN